MLLQSTTTVNYLLFNTQHINTFLTVFIGKDMKLQVITSPAYTDNQGITWEINCDKDNPAIKQYIEALIRITKEAKQQFKKPMAYHFWIRLNEGRTITEFMDNLKKKYLRNNDFNIIYLRVKETNEKDGEHHHILLFLDQAKTRPNSLSLALSKLHGKRKLLFRYELCEWQSLISDEERFREEVYGEKIKKIFHFQMKTEQDMANIINRGSYLAKTRSKLIGAGLVVISTSRQRILT